MVTDRPTKIIHVPRRFVAEEWGGTEMVVLEISRQQQRAGLQPEIYTSMALAKLRKETIGGANLLGQLEARATGEVLVRG